MLRSTISKAFAKSTNTPIVYCFLSNPSHNSSIRCNIDWSRGHVRHGRHGRHGMHGGHGRHEGKEGTRFRKFFITLLDISL